MLVNSSDCPSVSHLVQWITGAFDAIQHKYVSVLMASSTNMLMASSTSSIHAVLLLVATLGCLWHTRDTFSSLENPDAAVLETYSFKFSYNSDGTASIDHVASTTPHKLQSTCSSRKSSERRHEDIRKSTLQMLRNIIVLMQGLDDLPDHVYLSMRLRYYDHVTPVDYEPHGFCSSQQSSYVFSGLVATLGMGDVDTGHHSVALRLKKTNSHFVEDHPHLRDESSSQESTAFTEAPDASALQDPGNPNATSTPLRSTCSSVPSAAATTDDLPRGLVKIQVNDAEDPNLDDHSHDCVSGDATRGGDDRGAFSGDRAERSTRDSIPDVTSLVTVKNNCFVVDDKDPATPIKKECVVATRAGSHANESGHSDTPGNHLALTNNDNLDNGSVVEVLPEANYNAAATQESESVVETDVGNFQRSARRRRFNSIVWTSPALMVPSVTQGSGGEPERSGTREQLVPSGSSIVKKRSTNITNNVSLVHLSDDTALVSFQRPSLHGEAVPSPLNNFVIDLECPEQIMDVHSGPFPDTVASASQNTAATPTACCSYRSADHSISVSTSSPTSGVSRQDDSEKQNIVCTPVQTQGFNDGDATPLLTYEGLKSREGISAEVKDEELHESKTPVLFKLDPISFHSPIQRAPSSAGSVTSLRSVSVTLAPSCPSPGYPVRCACSVHADDGLMILCDVCGYWQHGACYSILRVEDAPEKHLCHLCSNPPNLCSDSRLCFLSPLTLEETCLFRRSLSVLCCSDSNSNTNISCIALAQRLGCDVARANAVVEKLLGAGVLIDSEVGGRKRKRKLMLNYDALKNDAVPKFFKKQNSQSMKTEEPQATNQHSQEWAPRPKKCNSSMSTTGVKKCSGTTP
ncbi:HORMA domain [Trinorchestia longiramus]|nr:HORMA domain [Trinorchestia longiramus]